VCPAARSGVGGTVRGMLSPPLLSLFSVGLHRGDEVTKATETAAGLYRPTGA
jgi:hypothetical protein